VIHTQAQLCMECDWDAIPYCTYHVTQDGYLLLLISLQYRMFALDVLPSFQPYKALYIIKMNVSRNMQKNSTKKAKFISYSRLDPSRFTQKNSWNLHSYYIYVHNYIYIYIYTRGKRRDNMKRYRNEEWCLLGCYAVWLL
jgi:hypothetical protein